MLYLRNIFLLQQIFRTEEDILTHTKFSQLLYENHNSLLCKFNKFQISMLESWETRNNKCTFGVSLESPVESATSSIGTELKQSVVIILHFIFIHDCNLSKESYPARTDPSSSHPPKSPGCVNVLAESPPRLIIHLDILCSSIKSLFGGPTVKLPLRFLKIHTFTERFPHQISKTFLTEVELTDFFA